MIPLEKLIVFDVETHGEERPHALQPWRAKGLGADIRMYSFAWYDETGKIQTNLFTEVDRYRLSEQLMYFAGKGCYIVGWNTPFDIAWLLAYGLRAEVYSNKWLDGMLLWQRLETNKMRLKEDGWGKDKQISFGLKAAVKEFLPKFAGYEEGIYFEDFSPEMTAKMGVYCRKDTAFTLHITNHILHLLQPNEVRNAITEGYSLPMVAEAWMEGLHVDVSALVNLNRKVLADTDEARQKLYATDPFLKDVNLGSPKQLAEVLFDKWGLNSIKTTAAGARSTDKETLHELALFDPRAELLRKVREGQGNHSKFVEGTKESILYHQETITRPQPRVYGTYSGRMTYYSKQGKGKDELPTGVPLHQWKRDPDFRRIILPPPGYDLIELDAANQEYRWMAIESGDETMLAMCLPGEDAHSFMGAQIAETDYRWFLEQYHGKVEGFKDKRQLGKVTTLSLQYRTSAKALLRVARVQYDLPMRLDEAERNRNIYLASYPRVPEYWERQISRARNDSVVWTLGGRKLEIKGDWSDRSEKGNLLKWKMESSSINFPIQGVGADQKYLALRLLKDYACQHAARFYFELHDGILFVAPKQTALKVGVAMQQILNNLPYQKAWGFTPPIPLPWDLKVGQSFGDLKEIKG